MKKRKIWTANDHNLWCTVRRQSIDLQVVGYSVIDYPVWDHFRNHLRDLLWNQLKGLKR